jgi:hypothetical protein
VVKEHHPKRGFKKGKRIRTEDQDQQPGYWELSAGHTSSHSQEAKRQACGLLRE